MAQPRPSVHFGHQSPAPRSPSARAAQTTQGRPLSYLARAEGPLRRPQCRGSPRSHTHRTRSPRHHPPLEYSSHRLCQRAPQLTRPAGLVCLAGLRRGDPKRRSPSCASSPPDFEFCVERDRRFHEIRDGPTKSPHTSRSSSLLPVVFWPVMAKIAADVLEDPWKIVRGFGNFPRRAKSTGRNSVASVAAGRTSALRM
jgi:hypothetical protein